MPPTVANSNFLYRPVLWYCIYMTMIFPLTCVEQYFVEISLLKLMSHFSSQQLIVFSVDGCQEFIMFT